MKKKFWKINWKSKKIIISKNVKNKATARFKFAAQLKQKPSTEWRHKVSNSANQQ